ncbi:MAG: lipopolysaccharide heptosyltransferase II [Pseudomonadota bacterium]
MTTKRLLVIGPSWIGDMIMAQSLFKQLKTSHQDACDIDVIAPAWSHPLLARMPEVSQAWVMPVGHGKLDWSTRKAVAKQLALENYDQAILLPNSLKSALIPWFADIPQRTGWRGEMRYGLVNDMRILDKAALPQMIQRFCALGIPKRATLAKDLPFPELQIDVANVTTALDSLKLKRDKPILVLCPGAEFGPAKRWPAAYYREVAKTFLAKNWQIWVMGSEKDTPHAQVIAENLAGVYDLTGKTQLGQAIDLMSIADAVVSNDSGLMHMAAALQRKLVVIYGSSSPGFTPPLSAPDNVKVLSLNLSCSPCFKRECPLQHLNCLQQLSPNQVCDAVLSFS